MKNSAVVVDRCDGKFCCEFKEVEVPEVLDSEILIKTSYSSLNYKDALSSVGNPGVTKVFPHITGIDVSGEIIESKSADFSVGDKVVITGYDFGMNSDGGHTNYVKAPSNWAVKIPKDLDERSIMILGTAGLTAALSVNELLNSNVSPKDGKIAVTGATGGVGSIAVALLSNLGFEVVALTGKKEQGEFLKTLGVKEVLLRSDIDKESKRPMLKGEYAGVVDTVGGETLNYFLKSLKYDGVATCCGLTDSHELRTNVFPFILRGARLIGIDSVECSLEKKRKMWDLLATGFQLKNLEVLANEITLEEVPSKYKEILEGRAVGRFLVRSN